MKILNIIPYKVLPARLGGEKAVVLFNEYIGKKKEVLAVSVKSNHIEHAKNFRMLNILSGSRFRYCNPLLYFKIRRLIKKNEVTHLAIEHPYFGWLAYLLRNTLSIQWFVRSHNIEYQRSASIGRKWWKWLKIYESWVYRKADLVFFISEDDRQLAIKETGISPDNAFLLPYGITENTTKEEMGNAKLTIQKKYGIPADKKILLFNGALYHHTNYDALRIILDEINPILFNKQAAKYVIIICGKGLPGFFNELKEYTYKNIIYAGFVEDISLYFKAADIFLNPIIAGGGVKTKAIEAIGYHCTVVSSKTGAMGINYEVCGDKLIVIPENNWKVFAEEVLNEFSNQKLTPDTFFEYYNWDNIADNVIKILENRHA